MENFIFCSAQCVKKFYYLRENSKYSFGVGTDTKLEERFWKEKVAVNQICDILETFHSNISFRFCKIHRKTVVMEFYF